MILPVPNAAKTPVHSTSFPSPASFVTMAAPALSVPSPSDCTSALMRCPNKLLVASETLLAGGLTTVGSGELDGLEMRGGRDVGAAVGAGGVEVEVDDAAACTGGASPAVAERRFADRPV